MASALLAQPGVASTSGLRSKHSNAGSGQMCHLHAPQRPSGSRRVNTQTCAFGGSAALMIDDGSSLHAISQIATAAALGLGAWFVSRELAVEQDVQEKTPECSTCNGTGVVECTCSKWSDGDVGCATCKGSGKASCHHCGGGGRGVPIPVRIRAESDTFRR